MTTLNGNRRSLLKSLFAILSCSALPVARADPQQLKCYDATTIGVDLPADHSKTFVPTIALTNEALRWYYGMEEPDSLK